MEKEKPLLGESGGSGGGSGSSSSRRRSVKRRDQPPKFTRRSDAITYGSRYQKAAALVDLAEDGVGIPEQILDQENFEHTAKYYFFYIKFDFIWTLNYFAILALNFLEKPLWCLNSEHSCNDRDYFYLGELPYLTTSESLIFEGITLIILVGHIFFPISYEGFRIFWNNPLSRMKVACLAILVADILVYLLYLSPVALNVIPFRIAPYIRVVLFILAIRDLQKTIVILGGMLRTYLNVLALWLLFLLFASWLAYVIFEDTQQGKTVFTSYGITLYQMFVLFTTSNNPDVWIPAYKTSRFSCLFFVLYVLLGVYFVTNLVLAVVYDSFKSQLVKQISETDSARQRILIKVFNLIDEDNVGFLNKEQCILLFHELNRYRTLPNISREEFGLIFDELDDSHDFKINLGEFADLCNAIALKFQKEDVESYFEYLGLYHWPSSEKLKVFVRSPIFGYIVSFILTLNLIAVIIETTLDMENNSAQQVWQVVESVFGWIYVVEMALKVYAFGFANYWRDGHNRFDFMITWIIVVGETITFASPNGMMFFSNGEWIRYLLIARVLRLIRILMHIQSCRAFVATFLTLIPSLMPSLGTIFCVMCMYCSLGVQIFGGIVNVGNPKLDATDLADNDYLLFNFNDYPNGMMTLFNLLVMQNWQAWMQGYKDLTGTWWSLTYFISYYLITLLLLLNLVVAFVLEAFFAELDIEKSENGEGENKDVTGVKSRRHLVGAKTRSQRIDLLLHHMLSAELGETEQQSSDGLTSFHI